VPADGASKFPATVAPPGAKSPSIVYPLQNAVMPTSVKAPVGQLEGGGPAHPRFRVRLVSCLGTVGTIRRLHPLLQFPKSSLVAARRLARHVCAPCDLGADGRPSAATGHGLQAFEVQNAYPAPPVPNDRLGL